MVPVICRGIVLLALASPAVAEESDWTPVPDSTLAEVRGGFDTGGLLVSLSVERLLSINGAPVAQARLDIPDVARMSAQEAAEASRAMSTLLLQNSLNDQLIRSQTTISTTVATLAAVKNLNLEGSLRQALSQVVTPR